MLPMDANVYETSILSVSVLNEELFLICKRLECRPLQLTGIQSKRPRRGQCRCAVSFTGQSPYFTPDIDRFFHVCVTTFGPIGFL